MLVALFLFTVLAGLAGAIWEWIGISRLLVRDHPEETGGIRYPALTRKIENTLAEPESSGRLEYPATVSPAEIDILRNGRRETMRPYRV